VNKLLKVQQNERITIYDLLKLPYIRKELDAIMEEFTPLTHWLKNSSKAHKLLSSIVKIQSHSA